MRSFLALLVCLSLLPSSQAQQLTHPLNLGSQGGHILPTPFSEDIAAHIRGTALVQDLPSGAPQLAVQLGLSASLFHWGEVGASLAAAPRNGPGGIEMRPGPLTMWGRLSPPLFGEHWQLAAQLEYAAAPAPLDGGGTLFPDTETISALFGYRAGRLQLVAQGAGQLADGRRYRGVQAGAGMWFVVLRSMGLAVGVEAVGRAGRLDGEPAARTGWTVALGIGTLDEWGFRGGVGYFLGDGVHVPASTLAIQMGVSWGRPYQRDSADIPPLAIQESVDAWWQRRQAARDAASAGRPVSPSGALQSPAPGAGQIPRVHPLCDPPITHLWARSCAKGWSSADIAPDRVREVATDQEKPPTPPDAKGCPWCRPSPVTAPPGDGQGGFIAGCLVMRWVDCGIKPWDAAGQKEAGGMPVVPMPGRRPGPSVATTSSGGRPPPAAARPAPPSGGTVTRPAPPSGGGTATRPAPPAATKPTPKYELTDENVGKMRKGNAPDAADGSGPMELHHPGQKDVTNPKDLVPMTPAEHRMGSNYKKNHPTGNSQPSVINRNQFKKVKRDYWKDEAAKVDDDR